MDKWRSGDLSIQTWCIPSEASKNYIQEDVQEASKESYVTTGIVIKPEL